MVFLDLQTIFKINLIHVLNSHAYILCANSEN